MLYKHLFTPFYLSNNYICLNDLINLKGGIVMSCTTFIMLLVVFGFCQYIIFEIDYKQVIRKLVDRISKDVKIIRRDKDE